MKRKFPHAEIVSAHDHVMATQEIKSKLEIDVLREACSISTLAIENGLESLKEGITEREICGIIKAEMYRLGAGGIPFLAVIAGWDGRSICCDSHPTSYGIQKGDVVQVDGGCSVKGYCADMCRTGALGFVKKDRYGELYEISKGAHFSVRSRLKNGAPIRDVCLAGKTYIREKGYGSLLVFGEGQTGHGIGLDLHQPPYLLDDSTGTLKSGMVVAIEPAISENPDWDESSYFTIVENNYAITDDGYEQLTNSDEGIRIV
jgi:Xaa-Pro aminopeptidase